MIERLNFPFPCAHGCDFLAAKRELEEHEKECKKRMVPCPDGWCRKTIHLDTLLQHLNATEQRQPLEKRDGVFSSGWCLPDNRLQDSSVSWNVEICKYDDNTFFAKLAKAAGMFHVWLYVAAGAKVAKKYQVKFTLTNSTTSLLFMGNVFPIDVKEADVIMGQQQDVLSFGQSYLRKEKEADQEWKIMTTFEIWKL
jgi:hypothetical protein